MKTLQTRKQILIAESDINRMLLLRDYDALMGEVRGITRHFKKLARLASFAGTAFSAFKAFRK